MLPIRRLGGASVGQAPRDVGQVGAGHRGTGEEPIVGQGRVGGAQVEQASREAQHRMGPRPVEPSDGVVLAVGVVIATLRLAEFGAGPEHRRAARQRQRGEEVALVPRAGGQDGGIPRRPLGAVVPGQVLVAAVAVALAVGFVVLAVIGDDVGQGEAVVRGDEVDRARGVALGDEQVGRARDAPGEVGRAGTAGPEAADVVAVPVVPLAPEPVEVAHLVAAGADVPGLGDELQPPQHGILRDGGDDGGVGVEARAAAAQHGHEVEPEAVDAAVPRPAAQRIEHQPHGGGALGVEDVAAAGVVDVAARVGGVEPVVGRVVEAAQAQRRAVLVALARVVVDDIEQHLDAGFVQGRRGVAHLGPAAGRQARVGRQQGDGVVAPGVGEAERPEVPLVGPGHGGHQLDRGDAQRLEVRDAGRRGQPGEGAAEMLRHAGVQLREATHVQFEDAGPLPGGRAAPRQGGVGPADDRLRHGGAAVAPVGFARSRGGVEHRVMQGRTAGRSRWRRGRGAASRR